MFACIKTWLGWDSRLDWAIGYIEKLLAQKQPAPDQPQPDKVCAEADGCPTELAVLQRYWRDTRFALAEAGKGAARLSFNLRETEKFLRDANRGAEINAHCANTAIRRRMAMEQYLLDEVKTQEHNERVYDRILSKLAIVTGDTAVLEHNFVTGLRQRMLAAAKAAHDDPLPRPAPTLNDNEKSSTP